MSGTEPRIEQLEAHPYVLRADDVSFQGGRELLEVSFPSVIPEPFTALEEISIVTCWIDTDPGWWGTVLGEDRARRYGLGRQCVTALVEVQE